MGQYGMRYLPGASLLGRRICERVLPMVEEDEVALWHELARLQEEHRELDGAIAALDRIGAGDRLQVQRLKKRKLVLKDRIARIEDALTPDIIA